MRILIRGAGDIASGIAVRLFRAGFEVVMTDLPSPTAIRRTVCFSEAIRVGRAVVEDIPAELARNSEEAEEILAAGRIAVLKDPEADCRAALHPDALVDAILAKRNLGTRITDAPVVIGVGPGFTAGADCHAAVESMRGHRLGRVIYSGSPMPDTGVPGQIGGYTVERVLRAPADGVFVPCREIGDHLHAGDTAGYVGDIPMICAIDGVLRGILPEGTEVIRGMKSGDVDPRDDTSCCYLVSEKALAIGGGVMEAFFHFQM